MMSITLFTWKSGGKVLLGRKVMTNIDNLLKSRAITLPTKVRLVKIGRASCRERVETVTDFILRAPKSLQMVTAAMKLKDACSLGEKL